LTHGNTGTLHAKDGIYPTENVFKSFIADTCPSLIGKPKLFFIQVKNIKNMLLVFNL